jgi:hypothetical protein
MAGEGLNRLALSSRFRGGRHDLDDWLQAELDIKGHADGRCSGIASGGLGGCGVIQYPWHRCLG